MGHQITIGGQRLGSGKKMTAYLHNYERSTHDLGYVWRSTMAAGTLVPFMNQIALPGDTFDIDLNVDILTQPTIGPLFGSYKIQLDVFQIPFRLYQGKLHMNMLGIGMDMSKVALPLLDMEAPGLDSSLPPDNQQINPSSIFAYLGIRGLGTAKGLVVSTPVKRQFNAIGYLGYWDVYKNYYANKQEEVGAVIHKDVTPYLPILTQAGLTSVYNATTGTSAFTIPLTKPADPVPYNRIIANVASTIYVKVNAVPGMTTAFDPSALLIWINKGTDAAPIPEPISATDLFEAWELDVNLDQAIGTMPNMANWPTNGNKVGWIQYLDLTPEFDNEPQITRFPLENIDTMRRNILAWLSDAPFIINKATLAPYGLSMQTEVQTPGTNVLYSQKFSQEGLALKTYQSDLLNNWVNTDWIDGPDGISEITKIDTSAGSFTIDELNMSKKIYDMLNRIAISGGSYDDWLDAVYTHERQRSAENPMYLGGLIRNLVFQEVISNAATGDAPLGTLAGRGRLGHKEKGGHIVAKIDEPSYLMGIISLTPNVDYSQGNIWDVNLKTLNDLHKPALDEIGFQDLIGEQAAYWNTEVTSTGVPEFYSRGKQPAWINYMTNINIIRGNFAEQTQQMFMVLNRRYEVAYSPDAKQADVKDFTTYIDPTKFNHIFADTRRDAQNFWAQVGVNITARRKMSAKIMPNL